MTSKLICPFCRRALARHGVQSQEYGVCRSENCPSKRVFLPIEIWQALIQAKEELKDCQYNYSVKSEQHERGYVYATKTIKDLESKLEIVIEALEKLKSEYNRCRRDEFDGWNVDWGWFASAASNVIDTALKRIKHKDEK